MEQVPILVISDAPDQNSGLARICRDLCTLLTGMPEFRVATLGKYGLGSSRLPWTQFQMQANEWGNVSLPLAWDEFSQDAPGIVLTIWDVTRLLWLARPEYCEDEYLRGWLTDRRRRRFRLWSYVPVDSTGPRNQLTAMSREVLLGVDRIVTYSPFAVGVIRNTIGEEEAAKRGLEWLPHGLNLKTFTPLAIANKDTRINTCEHVDGSAGNNGTLEPESTVVGKGEHEDNALASSSTDVAANVIEMPAVSGASEDDGSVKRIGIVATNQARKDFGAMGVVMAALVERLAGKVRFWIHVDQLIRHWSIPAIIADFGLGEYAEVTQPPMSDGEMAERLRMCDLTLHPGSEGFGFPIFESLACGVPVLHGDYAGGASLLASCGLARYLVQPVAFRLEGQHNCLRAVYEPADWVNAAIDVLAIKPDAAWLASRVQHLSWMKLGWPWKRWLREGIGNDSQ